MALFRWAGTVVPCTNQKHIRSLWIHHFPPEKANFTNTVVRAKLSCGPGRLQVGRGADVIEGTRPRCAVSQSNANWP